jgi:hypothetical protein
VRDACDLGYLVTLATDACATHSIQRQQASLAAVAGYCRQRTADQLVQELAGKSGCVVLPCVVWLLWCSARRHGSFTS